jgi:hypothetical protein
MLFGKKPESKHRGGEREPFRCSFCGKAEAEVAKLIAGESGLICDECVRVCVGILAGPGQPAKPPEPAPPTPGEEAYCAFCGRPMTWDEAVLVPEQGAYCQACIAAESKPVS